MAVSKAARPVPVVLDSSCWLEYFSNSPRADLYAEAIANTAALIVPIITIYEVYKVALREFGLAHANQAVALMREGEVVDINLNLALNAAATGLPMADSLIYATAQTRGAILWTQDAHFKALAGVKFFAKE
ncbi:type II toxin-antitoxin system VapC family toxin [Polaromonas sp.]|uniref:type II toxin-antitoxin system VapC family toxin n=1 Tax=Polaromonas sp. TaxID=1869339 RepID=UPI003BB76C55